MRLLPRVGQVTSMRELEAGSRDGSHFDASGTLRGALRSLGESLVEAELTGRPHTRTRYEAGRDWLLEARTSNSVPPLLAMSSS